MKTTMTLPENYAELARIDLQRDRRLAILVNVAALVVAVLLVAAALPFAPISLNLGSPAALLSLIAKMMVLAVSLVLYIVLHEAVHGVFIRLFSGVKPKFGFTGLYAFAGSDAYFARTHYIVIALAPLVLWGVALLALALLLPPGWFWVVYTIQVINLSGAVGDLYVTGRMLRLPADLLVQDVGVSMTIYGPVR